MIPSFVSMTRLFMAASTTIPSKEPVASVIISPAGASPASSVPVCVTVSVKVSCADSCSVCGSAIASAALSVSCAAVALSCICVSGLPQAASPGAAVIIRQRESARPAALFILFFSVLLPSILSFLSIIQISILQDQAYRTVVRAVHILINQRVLQPVLQFR